MIPVRVSRTWKFQAVMWPHPYDWSFGVWRWPDRRPAVWPSFGFWALALGPLEFRFWPDFVTVRKTGGEG